MRSRVRQYPAKRVVADRREEGFAALVALLFTGIEPSKELLALYCTSYGAVITYFFTHKGA